MFIIIAGHTVPPRDQKRVSGFRKLAHRQELRPHVRDPAAWGICCFRSTFCRGQPALAVLHVQVGGESAGGSRGEKDLCILLGTFSVLKINSGNQDTKLTIVQIRK